MMHTRYAILPLALITSLLACAQYNGPESVEYDPVGDRYFVSNTGSNAIKQRAQDGTVTNFASGLADAPYGIELRNDTLFACTGGSLSAFTVSDGSVIFQLDLGATFLNGITCDEHFVYVTDFSAGNIIKVDPQAGTFTTLVHPGGQPNGIVWEPGSDRLWTVFWGSNAKIRSYDRNTGAQLSTYTTALSNIDGVALDCNGRICVSSWSPARISAFEPTFTQAPVDLGVSGLSSPADLDFDAVHQRLCIPNSGNNTVSLAEVDCSIGIAEEPGYGTFTVVPDPTDGHMRVELPLSTSTPFLVFDMRGLLVASGTLKPDAWLDITTLKAGAYVLDLPSLRKRARLVKY